MQITLATFDKFDIYFQTSKKNTIHNLHSESEHLLRTVYSFFVKPSAIISSVNVAISFLIKIFLLVMILLHFYLTSQKMRALVIENFAIKLELNWSSGNLQLIVMLLALWIMIMLLVLVF